MKGKGKKIMTFSEQFKEVVEVICDKIGIAIDWTQDNVIPYIMEVCKRYVTLNIIEEALFVLFGVILVIVGTILTVSLSKDAKRVYENDEDGFWFETYCGSIEPNLVGFFGIIGAGIALIVGIVCVPCGVSELLKWIFIPEFQIIEEITSYLSAM
jgi:hypothetical protein